MIGILVHYVIGKYISIAGRYGVRTLYLPKTFTDWDLLEGLKGRYVAVECSRRTSSQSGREYWMAWALAPAGEPVWQYERDNPPAEPSEPSEPPDPTNPF